MPTYQNPSGADQSRFLRRLYFGAGNNFLELSLNRAYLDLNRTLHGVGKYPNARKAALGLLQNGLTQLRDSLVNGQDQFDNWHRTMCGDLIDLYERCGYDDFYAGQAQKWINMAFKYLYVFGEDCLPGFKRFYQFCHVPIDNIILGRPAFVNAPRFGCAWSRIKSYDQYMTFQMWVRESFPDSSPLAVEFWLWPDLA